MCANLADPALASVARGRGPATVGATGLSTGHLADLALAGVACGCGPAAAGAAGLLAGHRPLHAARSRGPAATAELRWTCGPDSSAGGQRQEQAMKSRLGNLHLRLSPTE